MDDPRVLIRKEREGAAFDVRKLTYIIDGSEEETRYREEAASIVQNDPILYQDRYFDLTRPEARAKCMAQIRRMMELKKTINDPKLKRALDLVMTVYDRSYGMRTYVHDTLFRETILTHGTPAQFQYWKEDIDEMRVLGCFAMTELGHSSFLRGLETTATFDPKTQEFVLNSPTLTATKWWIGMAGQVATHTVAICQLIVNGKELGLHWFVVPLRSTEDGSLIPGVLCGDVGAKAGRNGLDNGWIQFKNVRIPREYMLMKWSFLSPEGELKVLGDSALAYNTLIGERVIVGTGVADAVGQALTIGIRYAVVRQQGQNNEKIMDFQSHYHTLVPILATLFATVFVAKRLRNSWNDALSNQDKDQQKFIKSLGDYHGVSAGMKAWLGWWGADALELIRRTMGGHGYSAYSAIPGLIADYAVITQGGGDNVVLAQQTARYLVGSLRKVMSGKPVGGSVSYLAEAPEHTQTKSHFPVQNSSELLNLDTLLNALKWLALEQVTQVGGALFKASQAKGLEGAWNDTMAELITASRVHTWYYVGVNFVDMIRHIEDAPIRSILEKLAVLLLLHRINTEMSLFLEGGFMDAKQSKMIRQAIVDRCQEIRPQVVPLIDALGFPDFVLKSPFGRFDGDVYSKYFEMVNDAPGAVGRPSYWESDVAPLTRKYQKKKACL